MHPNCLPLQQMGVLNRNQLTPLAVKIIFVSFESDKYVTGQCPSSHIPSSLFEWTLPKRFLWAFYKLDVWNEFNWFGVWGQIREVKKNAVKNVKCKM